MSVISVFHRRSPHFAAAIESVRRQTMPDWELLLVDNGTGLGRTVLEVGPTEDSRIRIISLGTNEGIARGINAGVAAARSEFVALLDYDDIALPLRLERQVALLRGDPRLGLVNCAADTIDGQGNVTGREFVLHDDAAQRAFSAYGTPVVSPVYTGRRAAFLQHPHRPEFQWGSDYDFFSRVVEKWKVGGVAEPLQQYRRYPQQTTVTHGAGLVLNQCATRLVAARRRAGRPERLDELMDELRSLPAELCEADLYRRYARRCFAEGFAAQTVYHARRLVAAERRPAAFLEAARLVFRSTQISRGEAAFLVRLFLRGPLAAHGLRG